MERKLFKFITIALLLTAIVACNKEPVTGVKLDKSTLSVTVGGTATITAEVLPYSATNKTVSWSTSNSRVVTVENVNTMAVFAEGLITGKSAGEAMITVTTKDGKFIATCKVTVVNVEPEMVFVEGGTFTMGCTDEQGDACPDDQFPIHQVTLDGFYIAKYLVTQKEWKAIMEYNPSAYQGADLPVTVSWHGAQEFINKLNTLTGKNYRLPTEAEWEYAARGGNKSKGYKYSGSNYVDKVGWYLDNSYQTQPVGRKDPNELGIYDMSGNVWDWCSDWFGNYTDVPRINPQGPAWGMYRMIRGGCYFNSPNALTVSFRLYTLPNTVSRIGFRLVHPSEP